MPERLRTTWVAIVIALLAVVGSGSVILTRFVRHVFVDCRGTLVRVPSNELRYATRMHAWRSASLRQDGLVESETGATVGRLDPRARIAHGDVIVDPAAFEGRDVYREMPTLTRRNVGAGGHDRWAAGTFQRLRDARVLAVVATVTTVVALAARLAGG